MWEVCSPEIIQTGHQDWIGDGVWQEGAEGSVDADTVQSFDGDPLVLSLDEQHVALFQAEPGLVLIKKALKGLDVHRVV